MTVDRSTLTPAKIQEKYIDTKITIDKLTQCWLWKGSVDKYNRAKFAYPTLPIGKLVSADARRYLYSLDNQISRSRTLIPLCGQVRCVNPEHQRPCTISIKNTTKRKKPLPKLACKRGHQFTPKNTILKRNGHRTCRVCQYRCEKRFHKKRKLSDWQKLGDLVEAAELSTKLSKLPKKFYVYHLIDPTNELVFYVGKGCGGRVFQHTKDVGCGYSANHAKDNRILSILAQGAEVEFKIVKQNISEPHALWLEMLEIDRLGINNLTNRVSGTIPGKYRRLIA